MKKKQITNKTILLTAIIGSLLVVGMVTAFSIWSSRQTIAATEEAVSTVSSFYLEAMANRRAKIVTNLINNEFSQMEKALSYIEDEGIESQEELRGTLGRIKELLSLNHFALVDEDDIVYTQYTTYTGRTRHAFLSEKQLDGPIVDTVSLYGSSKQLCLAIPAPDLFMMGKPFKACFVQIDIKDIVDLLAPDDQGATYFGIYSKNGGNLSGTELGPVISHHNLLDSIKGLLPEDVWKETCDRFAKGESGSVMFSSGKVKGMLCYDPVQGTDWELAVLIHESVILDQIRDISENNLTASRNQILCTLVTVLLLALVLLLELRAMARGRLEKEKETSRTFRHMAITDSLTGVRNKHAYSGNEAALNQLIQKKEIQKLAVVVCDINGLKCVNDTRGHAAGDQLIKDACALICESFAHGAVFRIGGDEFAVLLQGKGYDTMMDDIGALNRQIEANMKENAVVISIGWSVLEPEDQKLRDVFERADQMMYKRKKELKAMAESGGE